MRNQEARVKATVSYWENRADAFMARADKIKRNQMLSRLEIQAFVVGNTSIDSDDKWFVEWLLEGDFGANFCKYDRDGNGEIDIRELRVALLEWAAFARNVTAESIERRRRALERKRELALERRQMLREADSRAAELMILCEKSGDGRHITVGGLRTNVEPIPKFRPFVSWLLKVYLLYFISLIFSFSVFVASLL